MRVTWRVLDGFEALMPGLHGGKVGPVTGAQHDQATEGRAHCDDVIVRVIGHRQAGLLSAHRMVIISVTQIQLISAYIRLRIIAIE